MKYIQTFRTIGLTKLLGEEEYYSFTSLNNSEKNLIYRPSEDRFFLFGYDRTEIEVRPEAKAQLLSEHKNFRELICEILKKDGTFHLAGSEHCLIAYRKEFRSDCRKEKYLYDRRERNDFYRFILFLGNGRVLQYLCTVCELLERFDFTSFTEGAFIGSNNYDAVKTGKFPLYRSAEKHDRYLYLAIKYLAGIATQEEADEAASIDGRARFVPEKKVYGAGVTVSEVKQIHPSLFNRSERYSCKVTIDLRTWNATWWKGDKSLNIEEKFCHSETPCGVDIQISDEVYNSLQKQAIKIYRTLP